METKVEKQTVTVLRLSLSKESMLAIKAAYEEMVTTIVAAVKETRPEDEKYPDNLENGMVHSLMDATQELIQREANMLSQYLSLREVVVEAMLGADLNENGEIVQPDPNTTH